MSISNNTCYCGYCKFRFFKSWKSFKIALECYLFSTDKLLVALSSRFCKNNTTSINRVTVFLLNLNMSYPTLGFFWADSSLLLSHDLFIIGASSRVPCFYQNTFVLFLLQSIQHWLSQTTTFEFSIKKTSPFSFMKKQISTINFFRQISTDVVALPALEFLLCLFVYFFHAKYLYYFKFTKLMMVF